MAQPLRMGLWTLSPAHQQGQSTRNPDSLFSILQSPYNHPSFELAFLPQALLPAGSGPFSLTPGVQIPRRRITVSLHLQGTRGIPCATRQLCPQCERWHLLVHMSLELLSSALQTP